MGVKKRPIQVGAKDEYPKKGQIVTIHYTGTLCKNGKQFDSSRDRDKPFQFQIGMGEVIRAWDEGIAKMTKGEQAILRCTPDYAYGSAGLPGIVPPNSDLEFDIKLLDIKDKCFRQQAK